MNEIEIIEFDYENNVICIYGEKEWYDYSISELKDYLNDIQPQLQAYKDKEDKLIKYCERLKKELKTYPKENPVELLNTHINIILNKLKESDK